MKAYAQVHTAGRSVVSGTEPWSGQCECTCSLIRWWEEGERRGLPGLVRKLDATDHCHTAPAWASSASCMKGEGVESNAKAHDYGSHKCLYVSHHKIFSNVGISLANCNKA